MGGNQNYFGEKYNKKERFELDSCHSGLGKSTDIINGPKLPMAINWHGKGK